jgi:hypothetical protein
MRKSVPQMLPKTNLLQLLRMLLQVLLKPQVKLHRLKLLLLLLLAKPHTRLPVLTKYKVIIQTFNYLV